MAASVAGVEVLGGMMSSAIFSEDRKFRYVLSRGDEHAPYVLFVGLNPSTADGDAEDATTRRLHGFASAWGYKHWKIVNLSAFVSTDPAALRQRAIDIVQENRHATWAAYQAARVIPCWGAGVRHLGPVDAINRPAWFRKWIDMPLCFGMTKAGHPKHPLYLPSDTKLVPFL